MQIWRLLKYQDVPPALKGFQDFVFTPMILLQFTETSSNLAAAQAAETS